nr:MAG TPA: hypothetical protein [Caudoviricetes sp.]
MDTLKVKKKLIELWIEQGFKYAFLDDEGILVVSSEEPIDMGDHYFSTGNVMEVDAYSELFPEVEDEPYLLDMLGLNLGLKSSKLN